MMSSSSTCATATTTPKHFLRETSLIRLYTILTISFSYFLLQMVIAHMTHCLILQVDAYHMLYNILGLGTSIVTTKMCRNTSSLKSTFGWTRIDVCGAVSSICFLAALCFSVAVEALQAMFHSTHHEKMSEPYLAGCVGLLGFVVNGVAFLVLGGFSYQQQGFLGSHRDGSDIVISPAARRGPDSPKWRCGGPMDAFRDFFGCTLVLITALVVHFFKDNASVTTFLDPCLTIFEVIVIAIAKYRFAREAGYILLLTIPNNIDVNSLLDELYESFPEIYDVHEFHIWQLNPSRVIATCHVVFRSTQNCWVVQNNVIDFLQMKGICSVTLQPEFLDLIESDTASSSASPQTARRRQCFLPCKETDDCHENKCCLSDHEMEELAEKQGHGHSHGAGGSSANHAHGGSGKSHSLHNFKTNDIQANGTPNLCSKNNKSTSALQKEEVVAEIIPVPAPAPVASSSKKPPGVTNLQPSVKIIRHHHHSESSDDDEKHETKPMI